MKQKLHLMLKGAMFFKALVVMLFAFAATGYAQTSGTWGGIDWTLDADGTLTIAPTTGEPVQDPNSANKFTYKVGQWREAVKYSGGSAASIAGWPYDRTKVKKLIIEEGVTSIGSFVAQSMTNLTGEVVIPWTVTYIGQEAFQKATMTKLIFQKVPEGETGNPICIAQGAFKNLIITEFSFPDDRDVHIHPWVLQNCKQLKHVVLPATIKSFGFNNQHIDYNTHNTNPSSHSTGYGDNNILASTDALVSVTFGSKQVEELFKPTNKAIYNSLTFFGSIGYVTKNGAVREFQINDGSYTEFENNHEALDIAKLIYQRTLLRAGTWNALYLPFELPVSALGDNYDVAYYNNMHARDRDNNGSIESMEMEVVLIKNGTLHAHHPYFIRAKNKAAENMNLELSNAKLLQTNADNHVAIETSSAYLDFTLTGTYNTKAEVAAVPTGIHYAIAADGSWTKVSTAEFNPFRVYLTMNEREDSHLKIEAQALAKMRIRVAGEETTEIDEVEMPISAQPTVVYDLQGRRVFNTEGLKGVYIVNGKKVAF